MDATAEAFTIEDWEIVVKKNPSALDQIAPGGVLSQSDLVPKGENSDSSVPSEYPYPYW